MRTVAALEEIRGRNTHRQSASNPYGRRRFANFVVLDASEPYFTKSEVRLRIPESTAKPVNKPFEGHQERGMRRIQVLQKVQVDFNLKRETAPLLFRTPDRFLRWAG